MFYCIVFYCTGVVGLRVGEGNGKKLGFWVLKQDATLSQGVPRDAAVNFGATGIIGVADI